MNGWRRRGTHTHTHIHTHTTHSGILLGHNKKWNNAICSHVDGPRHCHTTWSKTEKDKYHIIPHIWNLKYVTNEVIYKTEADSQTWKTNLWFSSVQSVSRVQLFSTPWTAAPQASLSISNSWSLIKFVSIKSVIPSNHFTLCRPLLLLPSILPIIRVFSSESILLNRWPKYWSFNFNISPSNEYSGWISFRMDWFDLAVQATLKSLLQHDSLKASIQVVGERETRLADASLLCLK